MTAFVLAVFKFFSGTPKWVLVGALLITGPCWAYAAIKAGRVDEARAELTLEKNKRDRAEQNAKEWRRAFENMRDLRQQDAAFAARQHQQLEERLRRETRSALASGRAIERAIRVQPAPSDTPDPGVITADELRVIVGQTAADRGSRVPASAGDRDRIGTATS